MVEPELVAPSFRLQRPIRFGSDGTSLNWVDWICARLRATFQTRTSSRRPWKKPDLVPEESLRNRRSLNVALDELLQNTIVHGFAGRKGGVVTIAVELGTDRLTVTLTDNGRPFNPLDTAAPDTTRFVEERPVGGLGIHLVRQLMDEVHYQRRGGRNVVVLVKRLTEV